MLEFYKYITSDFGVFFWATIFSVSVIMALGWSVNSILIGFRGKKCSNPFDE
jgi:hypothetical protein